MTIPLGWGTGGLALVLHVLAGLPRAGQPLEPDGRTTGGWALLLAVLVLGPLLGTGEP